MAFFGIRTNYSVSNCWFNLFPSLANTAGPKGSNFIGSIFPGNFLPIHSKTHIFMKRLLLFLSAMLLAITLSANNTSISNVSLTGKNTGSQYILVQFDISWENSWRSSSAPNNWDAAWVFVKYRVASGAWQHAWLNESGHTAPSGSTIDPGLLTPGAAFNASTNPGLGAFIYRSADGTGTFSKTGVQLRWNYGANGVANDAVVEVSVFAIEMVYVLAGSFAAGSGGGESSAFTLSTINTPNATTAPSGTGSLGGAAGGFPTGQTAPANASWPNGYNPFYCMKYEISQQQYVDFLITLTQTQATARKYDKPTPNYRYEITGMPLAVMLQLILTLPATTLAGWMAPPTLTGQVCAR
jgi:hypothetical protein